MKVEFDRKNIFMFFDAINSLTGEGMLHIKTDQMFFQSVDTANVAFIHAKYNQTFDSEMDIALDCQKIKSTIGALTSKMVSIDFNSNIHIKGGKVERDIRSLSVSTLRKEQPLPNLTLPVCVEVPSCDFVDIMEAIDKMGVTEGSLPIKICFEFDGKNFKIHCENDIKEVTKLEFDTISVEKGNGESHRSYFSFDYIRDMAKMIKKINNESMMIYIGTDMPFKLEAVTETMSVTWLLAPRIDTE